MLWLSVPKQDKCSKRCSEPPELTEGEQQMKTANLLATVGILLLLAVPAATALRPEDYALKYGGWDSRYASATTTFQVVKNIRIQDGFSHMLNRFNQFSRVLGTTHRTHNLLTGNAILDNDGKMKVYTVTDRSRIDFEPQSNEGYVSISDLLTDKAQLEFQPVNGEARKIFKSEIVKVEQTLVA